MYCGKCGNKINGTEKFCGSCGAKLAQEEKKKTDNIQQKKYLFNSVSDGKVEIIINNNSLTISRPGLISKFSHGLSGEKTLMISNITAVQFKKVGFSRGYIQFVISGHEERKSGVIKGEKDENIIYFDNFGSKKNLEYNTNAQEIKNYIENYNAQKQINPSVSIIQNSDKYDKLKKLKELLDNEVITQEEFNKEKEKILTSE